MSGFTTFPARDRNEEERKRRRIERLEKALQQAQGTKREELEAELRALRLPPTV